MCKSSDRDEFAKAALPMSYDMLKTLHGSADFYNMVARRAYQFAEAMVREKARQESEPIAANPVSVVSMTLEEWIASLQSQDDAGSCGGGCELCSASRPGESDAPPHDSSTFEGIPL